VPENYQTVSLRTPVNKDRREATCGPPPPDCDLLDEELCPILASNGS
jgi:hypothetical protein